MKKIIILFMVFTLTAVMSFAAYGEETIPEKYKIGVEYLQNEKYDEAVDIFSEMIAEAESEAAYLGRGDAYIALGQADKALEDYRAASNMNQRSAFGYIGMVDAYIMLNDFGMAIVIAEIGVSTFSVFSINIPGEYMLRDKLIELKKGTVIESSEHESGRESKVSRYDADGKLLSINVYEYDEKQRTIKMTYYDGENNIKQYYIHEFDENSRMISEKYYDGNGVLLKTIQY